MLLNKVWVFSDKTKTVKLRCTNCEKSVQHTQKYKAVRLSNSVAVALVDTLNKYLSVTTRSLYQSTYVQSLSEVTFVRSAQAFLQSSETAPAMIRGALDLFFACMRDKKHALSQSSLSTLKRAVLRLSKCLIAADTEDGIADYLFENFAALDGFSWGFPLFDLGGNFAAIIRENWLIDNFLPKVETIKEVNVLFLFAQIPWAEMSKYTEQELAFFIFGSLKQFITHGIEHGYNKLVVLCLRLATYACNLYPALTHDVLSLLIFDPALPTLKTIASFIVPLLPFNALPVKDLILAFNLM